MRRRICKWISAILLLCISIGTCMDFTVLTVKAEGEYEVPVGFMNERPEVDYGVVKEIQYYSNATNSTRKAKVVLPAGYTPDKEYPVMYLLHGIGGNEATLYEDRVTYVIGNAIHDGAAREMIVVLPNACANETGAPPADADFFSLEHYKAYDNFLNDLTENLMPYISKNFPIKEGRDHTAISGFSMGGRISLYIGFSHPDKFRYIGAFCPAPGMLPYTHFGVSEPGYFTESTFTLPEQYMDQTLVQITAGTADTIVAGFPLSYHNTLAKNQVPHLWYETAGGDSANIGDGGHGGPVYKHGLYNFMKRIFHKTEQEIKDQNAADEVTGYIRAIGAVEYTSVCQERIQKARNAYDALTEAQKALVNDTDYAVLKEAEKKYEELKPVVSDIFEDINEEEWFVDYVQYVYDKKIMTGLDEHHFGPAADLSRAHFATLLYRMAGEPKADEPCDFSDVDRGQFYTKAVDWASSKDVNIISGYEDGTFGPADLLTREQMVVLMHRYLKNLKTGKIGTGDYDEFSDAADVSGFAKVAMGWAVGSGIITGDQNMLNPQGNTSRAVCATIIMRFAESLE